jgi:hypothetical protein
MTLRDRCKELVRELWEGKARGEMYWADQLQSALDATEDEALDAARLDWIDANGATVRRRDNGQKNLLIWNPKLQAEYATIRAVTDQAMKESKP